MPPGALTRFSKLDRQLPHSGTNNAKRWLPAKGLSFARSPLDTIYDISSGIIVAAGVHSLIVAVQQYIRYIAPR